MRVFAALLAAAPLAAFAEVPAAPEPQWSLGAGVAFGVIGYQPIFAGNAVPQITAFAPGATASVERRLGASTWLVLGAAAHWYSMRQDAPPGANGITRDELRQFAVRGGVRFALSGAGAPVEVSAVALAGIGYAWRSAAMVTSIPGQFPQSIAQESRATSATADLGLALERELVPRLALRLETPLLGLTYGATSASGASDGRFASAGLRLAPSLALRLAF